MEYPVRLALFSLLLFFISAPLQAAVYQWKDENGRIHFSDRPVHENATEKSIKSPPKSSSPAAVPEDRKQRRQRMLDVYEKERAEKREAKAKEKQERKEQKRKCLEARARYDEYNSARSIYDYSDSGERKYLNKGEREGFIAELKANVARYCN
jgi:hypothetical protein